MIDIKYGNFVQDLLYIIPTKSQFIVPPSFREDLFLFQAIRKQNCPLRQCFCPIGTKWRNLIEDFPYMYLVKCCFIWPNCFRREDFFRSTNQKQELPIVAIFVNRGPCIDPPLSFGLFDLAVSEEKITI